MVENPPRRAGSAPWYLWAIGVVALLWNGLGVILWAGSSFMPAKFLGGSPADHISYVETLPAWSMLTWGLGVVGGFVGTILLLLRNKLAFPALAASLFGAVVNQLVYVTNPPPDSFFSLPLTTFIVGFAAFLLWFAYSMKKRGVLKN